MDQNPNRRGRAIIAGLLMLPAFGAVADFALRSARHADEAARYTAKAHVRAALDPLEERQLPTERLIEAAWDEEERP